MINSPPDSNQPQQNKHPQVSFLRRIPLAFGALFRILSNPGFAARVAALRQNNAPLKQASPDAALQLLALLQRDARLIDFTQETLICWASPASCVRSSLSRAFTTTCWITFTATG